MASVIYMPIINDKVRKDFYDVLANVECDPINYVAIGIQDIVSQHSTSLMSNQDWQEHFTTNQYAPYDPLRRAVLNSSRNIICFADLDCGDNLGMEIMAKRASFGMRNGLVVISRKHGYNLLLTLATDYNKFETKDFLEKKSKKISTLFIDLANAILSS